MKGKLLFIAFLISIFVQAQEDYTIHIGEELMKVELDKQYEIEQNNQIIKFTISANDTLLYKDNLFSFKYPKEFKVSKMNIEEGVEQFTLMTAEGSGIIIQKYSSMNPSLLSELMLNEVTKESVNYGFELRREDYERTLESGDVIDVDKAVLTYKEETNIYEITSIGKKDEGILIMTMVMDQTFNVQGKKLINLMWNSIKYFLNTSHN